MITGNPTMHLFRTLMVLVPSFCIAVGTAAQQAPDSARVIDANAVEMNTPTATLPGPRLAPQPLQSVEPVIPHTDAAMTAPAAVQRGQHTIVISTLALVLATILVVLLVAG